MAAKHKWTKEDCILVITEFVKRYKTEDYKSIEKDVAKKIGTSASSVNLTRANYISLLTDKREGFGSNISSTQADALLHYLENYSDVSDSKLIYILSN